MACATGGFRSEGLRIGCAGPRAVGGADWELVAISEGFGQSGILQRLVRGMLGFYVTIYSYGLSVIGLPDFVVALTVAQKRASRFSQKPLELFRIPDHRQARARSMPESKTGRHCMLGRCSRS